MKFILLFWGSLLIGCNEEKESIDTIRKYSYYVTCLNEDPITHIAGGYHPTGTGFFLRKNGKLFFVTNYHVYSGFDPYQRTIEAPVNVIYVPSQKGKDSGLLRFISKRDTLLENDIKNYKKPDLVFLEVETIPVGFQVNEINHLIDTTYFNHPPKNILLYGYPSKDIINDTPYGKLILAPYQNGQESLLKLVKGNKPKLSVGDSIMYYNEVKMCLHANNLNSQKGMSGSPVFGEFTERGSKFLRFIGVYSGRTPNGIAEIIRGVNVNSSSVINTSK